MIAPHLWPGLPSDGDAECISWKCAACGDWISEYEPQRDDCPIDWRNPAPRAHPATMIGRRE